MNAETPKNPSLPGPRPTPRQAATENLLYLAQELLVARFALMRCLEKLDLVQLLDVFTEVSETLSERDAKHPPRIITPRDRIQ